MIDSRMLLKKYFEENSFVKAARESFDNFIDKDLQTIIGENQEIEPTIIPHNIDEFKIKLDKIWVTKPEIVEADGSKRNIFPVEARLRKITYAAPIYMEVSAQIDGVQRESFTTQIGALPIMLKSKYCHLSGKSYEELIKKGEDPDDPGGYFIINGTERVIINIEDLASNQFIVENSKNPVSPYIGKFFSESGAFKIPHQLEKMKDGIFYLSFTRVRRIPAVVVMKALGLVKDEEIMKAVSSERQFDDVYINLYEYIDLKNAEDAADYIAKKIGITQTKEIRIDRVYEILDRFFLPHIGISPEDRKYKALNLTKMVKGFILAQTGEVSLDDKDHYSNKRLKLAGDLLADLFRVNLKVLIGDILYNFQRIVKRGKFPSIKVVIRDKLLTSRLYSSIATGNWVGGRKGISQRIQRINYLETISHLQRVVSPLSASQENFAARSLHSTHLGRLCPIETPEGTNIGLRKNLALMANVAGGLEEEEALNCLKNLGMETAR